MTEASAVAGVAEAESPVGLSPMQAGMLFESLVGGASGARGYDVEQMHLALEEPLSPEHFRLAWTLVARRHSALTASFHWEGVPQPVQCFHPDVEVPLEVVDWTALSPSQRDQARADFLTRDRARGFDLRTPPAMRVTLFQVAPQCTEVVWTFHHIVIDGRVMPQVLLEVFQAHAALSQRAAVVLPPPPPPYAEYIRWLEAQDFTASRAFFRHKLRGKKTSTPLPLAEPVSRAADRKRAGERIRFAPEPTRAAAKALAKATQTTLGTVVNAAWALVLARLTGDDDVLFGSTRACRRSVPGGVAEQTVGLFINTLPLRVRLREQDTVAELLAQLRKETVELRPHEHTSLVDIQAQSELPPGTPLFQTLVMFDNRELNGVLRELDPRWRTRTCTLHELPSPPLTLTVFDDDALKVRLLYDGRRFQPGTVDRLIGYFLTALDSLSADPERRLDQVGILPDEERRRILFEWNDTARTFPDQLCIQEPFEQRALAQPDEVAVEQGEVRLDYRTLEARANQLAHALRERGARPGVFVGICLDRTPDLVVALLGVAKSGAAYVPLDPEYPAERLDFMQEDAKLLLVVTQERHRASLRGPVLVIDGADKDALARQPSDRPARTAGPADVCYAIYTSGSTGKPKGVVLTHRAVVNTFDWVSRTFEVRRGDRLLFVTSPCFDLSVYDTFGALGAGATVVVASAQLLSSPQLLAEAVVNERITIWDSAPAALQRLVPFFPPQAREAPLRLVMLSGDWIPVALPDHLREAFPRAQVRSLGGATEAAIWSNWYPVGKVDPAWPSIPYGRPIQNARYHVLDAALRPVPAGVPGDLYIGGTCLADRYLDRAPLTAERFIPDPFASERGAGHGERLYLTGDLARYFEDGNLEFLGRADFQVKIRGYRVELGEVEGALTAFPEVRQAVCAAYVDASGHKSLAAYLVLREGAELADEAVKRRLLEKLPDFMVPSQVIRLEALPLSSNGKVNRKELPSPTASAASSEFVAPRTERERQMAELWRELLGKERVGVTDNFFALGGHSLLAVMLVSKVQKRLGVELPLSLLLEHPTVEGLVAALEGDQAQLARGRHVVSLHREGKRPPLVLLSGIGGFGFVFEGLARHFGDDQPLHVVHAIGAQDESEGFDHSMEEMAAIYEPQLLEACPEGPLFLGGYSFGMLVAFELAHRLRRRGRQVPLLVSFDGYAPGYPQRLPLSRRLQDHLRAAFLSSADERRRYLQHRLRVVKERVNERLGRAEANVPAIPNADPELDRRLRQVAAGLWRARDRYHPNHRDPADLLLIKSTTPERWVGYDMDDPLYGWGSWVQGAVELVTVPGEHLTLFHEANQRRMAEAIAAAMAGRA